MRRLVFLGLLAGLLAAGCGSTSKGGTSYDLRKVQACLKERPGYRATFPGPNLTGDAFVAYAKDQPADGDRQFLAPQVIPAGTRRLTLVFFRGGENFDSDDVDLLFFPTDAEAATVFGAFRGRIPDKVWTRNGFGSRFVRRGNVIGLWNRSYGTPMSWKRTPLGCLAARQ